MNKQMYLNTIAEECRKNLENIGITTGKIVGYEVNTRAKRRWGQTKNFYGGAYFTININTALLDGEHEDGLKSTLYHELLHTVEGCFNHGKKWDKLGDLVKAKYGYEINRTDSAENKGFSEGEYKLKAKYTLKCAGCGKTIGFQRSCKVVQHPDWYRCKCGGNLIRI